MKAKNLGFTTFQFLFVVAMIFLMTAILIPALIKQSQLANKGPVPERTEACVVEIQKTDTSLVIVAVKKMVGSQDQKYIMDITNMPAGPQTNAVVLAVVKVGDTISFPTSRQVNNNPKWVLEPIFQRNGLGLVGVICSTDIDLVKPVLPETSTQP